MEDKIKYLISKSNHPEIDFHFYWYKGINEINRILNLNNRKSSGIEVIGLNRLRDWLIYNAMENKG